MTARRGWCPTVHAPMATGDGYLARVKPPGGRLTVAAARILADAAARDGNGAIDLTSRAALQVRGLSPSSARRFAGTVIAAGLAAAALDMERHRNVITTPLAGLDPACDPATERVTLAIEHSLAGMDGLAGLPDKFGVVVDGGGVLPPGVSGDVVVRLASPSATVSSGWTPERTRVAVDDVAATVAAMARRASREGRRASVSAGAASPAPVGVIAFGDGPAAVCAAPPFGRADALILRALADAAERFGDGLIRLTPWRAICVAAADVGRADGLCAALRLAGTITDPSDPSLRIWTCPGDAGCASASVATRPLAWRLRPGDEVSIHVSGCDKGCAHPGAATVTLVGRDGRWDLVRNGSAGDEPIRRGLSSAEALAL